MMSQKDDILISRVCDAGLQTTVSNLALVERLTNNNAKDIHQLRVNCKRLRAYWRIIQPLLKNTHVYASHNSSLRNAARLLSQSREAHVNRSLIRHFMTQHSNIQTRDVFEKILQDLSLHEDQESLPVDQLRECFSKEQTFWNTFSGSDLKPGVSVKTGMIKAFSEAKTLAKRTLQSHFDATIAHEWRKWSKYLYYQLQLFSSKSKPMFDKKVLLMLDALNDGLGQLHDLFVLEDLIFQTLKKQPLDGATDVLAVIVNSRHQLERQLKKDQKKVYEKSFNQLLSL